jgi:hypothetical protein
MNRIRIIASHSKDLTKEFFEITKIDKDDPFLYKKNETNDIKQNENNNDNNGDNNKENNNKINNENNEINKNNGNIENNKINNEIK